MNIRVEKVSTDKTIIFLLCLFGLMSQLAIDSFTPSLPHITQYFKTFQNVTKLMISLYFFGMACSMLIFGYLSDKYGRKKSLIIGYIIFLLASILCTVSQSSTQLLLFRFLQGIGMSCSFVSYRAIMKDAFNNSQSLVKANLTVTSIVLFVPPLSLLIGGIIQEYIGWRGNFALHVILAIITIFLIRKYLYLKPLLRTNTKWLNSYKNILCNKSFILNSVCSGLASSLVFSFIEITPHFFQIKMGFSTINYSLISAMIIVAPIFVILLLKNRVSKMNMDKMIVSCASISVFFSILLILSYFVFGVNPFIIIIFCTFIIAGNAFQYTATYVSAYKGIDHQIGISSALFCFIKIITVAFFSLLVSSIYIEDQLTLGIVIGIPPLSILFLKKLTKTDTD